jgi:hypothetical protein
LLATLAVSGCLRPGEPLLSRRPSWPDGSLLPLHTVESITEFEELLAADRALVFVDVEWSMTSVQSRTTVAELVEWMESDAELQTVSLYRLDLSEQTGAVYDAAGDWFSSQRANVSAGVLSGNGALVWARRGGIIASEPYAGGTVVDALLEVTSNSLAE